jgi:hypothetical protein
VILVHGRNAGPANILDLVPRLARPHVTYLAPSAAGRTWYPHSFMAEVASNEPGLSSGLAVLESLVARSEAAGIPRRGWSWSAIFACSTSSSGRSKVVRIETRSHAFRRILKPEAWSPKP